MNTARITSSFRLRAGGMTASNVRNVCKTNSDMPSVSLLKQFVTELTLGQLLQIGVVSMNRRQSVSIPTQLKILIPIS